MRARRHRSVSAVIAGVLLAFILAVILSREPGHAEAARAPVSIHLEPVGQHELATSSRLVIRLRAKRTFRARVSAHLKDRSGQTVLTHPRSYLLRSGRSRRLVLPLGDRARTQVSECARRRIVVTVAGRRGERRLRRTSSTALRLDPPACGRFFGPRSFWNTPLPGDAPLDAQSQAITDGLLREVDHSFRAPPHPTINTTAYSTPLYTVARDQPRTRVTLDSPPGYAPHLESRFASVPVPAGARPAAGSDGHMVVWQPSTDTLWEFFGMRFERGAWVASWGGRLDSVSHGPGHYAPPVANLGATATSLSLAGGLMTSAELRRGHIDHALAVAVPNVRRGYHALPAQRSDGSSTSPTAVPEGARFRLDPKLNVDSLGLPPTVRAMAVAAQRYGIVVRDQSSVVAFYAEDPTPFAADPYPALFGGLAPWDLLRTFPWQHLQLTTMPLVASPGGERPGSIFCRILLCP